MTKLRFLYSKTPRDGLEQTDPTGTKVLSFPKNEILTQTDELKSICFDIIDNPYTYIFINQWKYASENVNKENMKVNYNEYSGVYYDTMRDMQVEMNSIIDEINSKYKEFTIPEELYLNIDPDDPQVDTLNLLHEYFEDASNYNNMHGRNRIADLYVLLEKINFLVHRMEGGYSNKHKYILVVRSSSIPRSKYYTLQPNDYSMFEPVVQGSLYIDYATVGKDFFNCVFSDDVELVKSNKISPQLYITPSMTFKISNQHEEDDVETIAEEMTAFARHWVETNNLESYVNLDDPNHSYGRIKLGTLSDGYELEECIQTVATHPYLYSISIEES